MASPAIDLKTLNNGKKPIAKDPARRAVYNQVAALYDAVHGPVNAQTAPPLPRRQSTPSKLAPAADWALDSGKDPADTSWIIVSGGAGAAASKQAGKAAVAGQQMTLAKGVLSSGGCIAWIPALVGMTPEEMRTMNAGAPSEKLLIPIDGLVHDPSKRVDMFLGARHMNELGAWFDKWMEYAGTPTFGDVKFPDGHPRPVAGPMKDKAGNWQARGSDDYRLSIGLTVYDLQGDFPAFTPAQLDDPNIIRKVLAVAFRNETPIGNCRQRFFPNDVEAEFPWLADKVDETRIADVMQWSCQRWPWSVPKLLQDPKTKQIKMLFDGASLNTHPDLWAAGFQPTWDNGDPARILASRCKASDRKWIPQSSVDATERPFHSNVRSTASHIGPLALEHLDVEERDAMFLAGALEAVEQFQELRTEIDHWKNEKDPAEWDKFRADRSLETDPIYGGIEKADATGNAHAKGPLHGFNLILQDRNAYEPSGTQLGW